MGKAREREALRERGREMREDELSRSDRRNLGHDDRDDRRTALAEARRRFGGIDLPASLAGTMAALGTIVFLGGLAAGAGTIGYQRGLDGTDISVGGLVAGLVILTLAFVLGGWVAGRMARYDGARNGFLSALLFVVLAAAVSAIGAAFGDRYDFFRSVNAANRGVLPQWFKHAATTQAVISAIVGVVVVLVAGILGGLMGARYHRRADNLLASTVTERRGDVDLARTERGEQTHAEREAQLAFERDHERAKGIDREVGRDREVRNGDVIAPVGRGKDEDGDGVDDRDEHRGDLRR